MESKHATVPTPWYVHKDATGRFYISGHKVAPHPPYICDVYRGNVPDSSGEAHALRIVACVNACEGLPTSALAASALSGGLVPREQLQAALDALRAVVDAYWLDDDAEHDRAMRKAMQEARPLLADDVVRRFSDLDAEEGLTP